MFTPKMHSVAGNPWRKLLRSLRGTLFQKRIANNNATAVNDMPSTDEPTQLASAATPICSQMLAGLKYPGAPKLRLEAVEALLEYMHRRAVEFGVPLDTPISAKGFRLGYAEGLVN